MGVMALFHLQKMFSFRFLLKKIDLSLLSISVFAKYLRVVEDGPGWGHLCHTDTFLVSVQKHRLWVLFRTVSPRRFERGPTIYVMSRNMKNIRVLFYLKIFNFGGEIFYIFE